MSASEATIDASETTEASAVDATLAAANVLLRVTTRSVLDVEGVVTMPQLRVLMLIALSGPQNPSAVALELDVHRSNATRVCERLVRAGLIARAPDTVDRRLVRLTLTTEGSDLVRHVLGMRRQVVTSILRRLDQPERDRLAVAFADFARAAGDTPTHDGRFVLSPGD